MRPAAFRALASLFVALLVAPVMPSAPAQGEEPADDGWQVTASLEEVAFHPSTLVVKVGSTVTWTNREGAEIPHDVKSDDIEDLDSGEPGGLKAGDTYEYKFERAGTYTVYCVFHTKKAMSQTVIVSEDGAPPAGAGESSAAWKATIEIRAGHITPHRLFLQKGTEVTFANKDQEKYTVSVPKIFGTAQKEVPAKGFLPVVFAEEGVFAFAVSGATTSVTGEAVVTVTGDVPEGIIEITAVGANYYAYWIGLLSFAVLILTLVFLFFYLKYGETAHSSDHMARVSAAARAASAVSAGPAVPAGSAAGGHLHAADFEPLKSVRGVVLLLLLVLAFFIAVMLSTLLQ